MREILKRRFISAPPPTEVPKTEREPLLAFGGWDDLTPGDPAVVVVCHPDWRGVRTAAYSFREPTIECDDLDRWSDAIVTNLLTSSVATVVVHGFPPGSGIFIRAAHGAGIGTRVVLHSSMTQHGAEAGEAAVANEVLALARGDALDRVVGWKGNGDVSSLAGKPIRLRFVLSDADLYALRFE